MGWADHLQVQLYGGVIVCLPQLLTVLSTFNSVTELQWTDGSKSLSQEEVLRRLLALAERAAHRSVNTSYTLLCVLACTSCMVVCDVPFAPHVERRLAR